ncbi:MAG: ribose-phosphate pyrophosphokinase [Clostridiales Family XIII bacterium]|jgi:ribose-phosphate pyrophosphokinase|nr:ribose-phosphate pyrophosphokinase [Clostridiales Family XIII bacterium]
MKNNSRSDFKIFTGTADPEFAEEVSRVIGKRLGLATVGRFSDGETTVSVQESVRGADCFIVQTLAGDINTSLMEVLVLSDALKRASANRITAVMPYYAYARQDRKAKPRDPITAKLVADLLMTAGVSKILTMDLHADQIQGFFNIPVNHLRGQKYLLNYLLEQELEDIVLVSPDHGSVKRTRDMAEKLDVPIAIIDKRRPRANVSEIMNIIGEVQGKTAVLIDDMIDTAGTITNAANAIKKLGANRVFACATHGVLSGNAIETIEKSAIEELILLNTIPLKKENMIDKIKMISVASIFADAIERIFTCTSISEIS